MNVPTAGRRPASRRIAVTLLATSMVAGYVSGCSTSSRPSASAMTPPASSSGSAPASSATGSTRSSTSIVIMQENRSFDTYFGTYPGRRRHPDEQRARRRCAFPTADRAAVRHARTSITPTSTAAARTAQTNARRRHQRRQDGRLRRPASRRRSKGCADPDEPGLRATRRTPDVMGYHTRSRHPELLDVRAELRAAGPHVRAERVVEPARAPVPGLGVVGARAPSTTIRRSCTNALQIPGTPEHAGLPDAAITSGTGPERADLRLDRPHLPAAQEQRVVGLLRRRRHRARLRERRRAVLRAGQAEREDAGHLEPAAVLRHRQRRRPARQHPVRRPTSTPPRRPARCPRCPGSCRPARSASTRPSPVSSGQSYVTSLDQRRDDAARTGTPPRSSWPGTTGAASTTTSRRPPSTSTATACASRHRDQPLRQDTATSTTRRCPSTPTTSSSKTTSSAASASTPHTDGRPDPRPDVRENASILGNLITDFDFTQTPRPPTAAARAPHDHPDRHPRRQPPSHSPESRRHRRITDAGVAPGPHADRTPRGTAAAAFDQERGAGVSSLATWTQANDHPREVDVPGARPWLAVSRRTARTLLELGWTSPVSDGAGTPQSRLSPDLSTDRRLLSTPTTPTKSCTQAPTAPTLPRLLELTAID